MIYFIFPLLFLIYCEILGRAFFSFIKKETLDFSFIIGFILVVAITYIVGWPITAFNGSFYTLLTLYVLLFLISIMFIIGQFRSINWSLNYKLWIIFVILLVFETYITLNRTLGELHGFDTLFYLNNISFNIGNNELNSISYIYGEYVGDNGTIGYAFQSFYYVIEVIIYVVRNLVAILGKTFENLPGYTLCFQLFLHAIYIGSSLTCIKEIKTKRWLQIAFVFLLVAFMNNFYYNNALGFIGNSYRMPLHAIATLFLFKFFKNKDKEYFSIFMITNLAICGTSTTGIFSFVVILFGLFYYLYNKEQDLIKWYVIFLFIPLINLTCIVLGKNLFILLVVAILLVILYLLNDSILKLFKNKYIRIGTLFAIMAALFCFNVLKSDKLIDVSKFFDNHSENADMAWDYFEFSDIRHWIFNILVLVPLFYYVIRERKQPFAITTWTLVLTVFNPFFSYAVISIMLVYYRSYDVIINNFTIIFFIDYFINQITNRKEIRYLLTGIIIVSTTVLGILQVPRYHDDSFIVGNDYNRVMRIDNKELEVINNVRQMMVDLKIDKPKIINNGLFLMPSFITNATYMYGREKLPRPYDNYDLWLIFFPHGDNNSYDNYYPSDANPKYNETKKLLEDSIYNILVLDNNTYYETDNSWKPLTELIENIGYKKTKYSTANYSVYYLE